MTTYEKFKQRVGCRKDNTVYITPYTIEVIPDDMRKATQWDKLQYLMSEGKVIKIFIAEPNRSVDELTFDFYREVGRFLMYKQLIDTYDPEKYFKRSSVKSQYAKTDSILEEMALDKYATEQMAFKFNIKDIMGNQRGYGYEKLRKEYVEYLFKYNKKTPPKRTERVDSIYDKPILEMEPKKEHRKLIRNLSKKMGLSDWSNDFATNVKEMIRVYAKTPIEELTIDDFVISTNQYVKLLDEPDDWNTPMKYYIKTGDNEYHQFKKIPPFVEGVYYELIKYDEKDIIKTQYDKYHDLVSKVIVKYYDCYKSSFSIEDRYMYQFIIETSLSEYEGKNIPNAEIIAEMKQSYYNSKHSPNTTSKVASTMMSYNERKTLLDKIICEVALNNHIFNYVINEGYDLNNRMNDIVSTYEANKKEINSTIEKMVLPFIKRSGV
jgi:hypothetical protein